MRIKSVALATVFALLLCLCACAAPVKYDTGTETKSFTDSAGREVLVPSVVTRVAPSGSVATMILATLCPEFMVSVSATPSSAQLKYLPRSLFELPTTGQMYGSRSTINLESLLKAEPQIIIDLGDRKDGIGSDMDNLQKTTGIATVFLEADLPHIAEAYRKMGALFELEERANAIADFIDETMDMAAENSGEIAENERKTVMYTSGTSGLATNAYGSTQAQVLELVGARNAVVVEEISHAGGGNIISLEQLYNFDPEIILFSGGSIYGTVSQTSSWQDLSAIKNNTYYEIPTGPYNWMSSPPSINMVLGVWWLGNLLYPEIYDYDMVKVSQRIYKLFWDYELSTDEAAEMLAASTLKAAA